MRCHRSRGLPSSGSRVLKFGGVEFHVNEMFQPACQLFPRRVTAWWRKRRLSRSRQRTICCQRCGLRFEKYFVAICHVRLVRRGRLPCYIATPLSRSPKESVFRTRDSTGDTLRSEGRPGSRQRSGLARPSLPRRRLHRRRRGTGLLGLGVRRSYGGVPTHEMSKGGGVPTDEVDHDFQQEDEWDRAH